MESKGNKRDQHAETGIVGADLTVTQQFVFVISGIAVLCYSLMLINPTEFTINESDICTPPHHNAYWRTIN